VEIDEIYRSLWRLGEIHDVITDRVFRFGDDAFCLPPRFCFDEGYVG
jgi:hypothetical protein